MDEPAVSTLAAGSLVKVTVIYQIGPVDLYVMFIVAVLRNQTRALKLQRKPPFLEEWVSKPFLSWKFKRVPTKMSYMLVFFIAL